MAEAAPVEVLAEIDSTNAEARRRAERGETSPVWIVARRQTAGRGRRGREWITQDGNLAATLLTTTELSAAEAAQITFVASLAVVDLLDVFTPSSLVSIKWPNDVMIEGIKASGILVESGPTPGGLWLAVGIGVNLAQAPTGLERPATAMTTRMRAEFGGPPPIEAAAEILADAFADWMERWRTLGFQVVLDAWARRAIGLNGACTARLGHETVSGVADGLAADGALRLRTADGSLRLISAGDVFFGEAA